MVGGGVRGRENPIPAFPSRLGKGAERDGFGVRGVTLTPALSLRERGHRRPCGGGFVVGVRVGCFDRLSTNGFVRRIDGVRTNGSVRIIDGFEGGWGAA